MLVIDGVKYQLWTPSNEDEFERVVKEHARDIFGEQSIYLDRKQKLKSLSGIGSMPDGYVIVFGDSPHWHIVEIELSSHPLYEHIVSQVGRFINGIGNPNTQRGIVNAIDGEIIRDDFLRLRLKKAIEPTEIYKFLADLISKQPTLTIVIEKDTQELREALNTLRYPQIKVVEFQTFTREGVGLPVHAHLFEPLYEKKRERKIGETDEYGYTLIQIEGDYEVYEKGGEFSIEKLPHRKAVTQGLRSLEEAIRWIRGGKIPRIEVKITPASIKYGLIPLPTEYRHLFPGYDEPFMLITDIGGITTHVTGAPAGTPVGDPDAGGRIQWNLKPWYHKHTELRPGDKLIIEIIEPKQKYRLEISKK